MWSLEPATEIGPRPAGGERWLLSNRRALDDGLAYEVARHGRHERAFALLVEDKRRRRKKRRRIPAQAVA